MNDHKDEDFISIGSFVEEMGGIDYYLTDRFMNNQITLNIENFVTETPCQLNIEIDEDNKVHIGAIPPMYYVETTFMPIFHSIKLNIERKR